MTAREWLEKARKESFAIGAFNIDTLEIFKAVVLAAKNKKSPVIVEFSSGEVAYFGLANILDLVINAREEYKIPILLNLDHGRKIEELLRAIDMPGYDEVHYDGSDLDLAENIKNTKRIVDAAHAKGLLVEGEINKLSGSSEAHQENLDLEAIELSYTNPKDALKYVTETGVDIFAPVFGNVHGTFPTQPDLDIQLLGKIHEVLPNTFLSLHGGSGIPAKQVEDAIVSGKIVKVNVNTELRQAFHDALSEKLEEQPNQYKFYELSEEIILAVSAVVESKIDVFGSAGKA